MALSTKIKHVDKRSNGVLRFRRRFPKDVAEALGEPALQVHIKNREGIAFHREYQAISRFLSPLAARRARSSPLIDHHRCAVGTQQNVPTVQVSMLDAFIDL